jgi:flavin reductase (DIM6/NTAB) family NADH-FMN oxidoreductase RutF
MTIAQTRIEAAPASSSDAFRDAMRQLASGVSIVTSGNDGEWAGITATSVTSLSLEPPTLLVCVNRTSSLVPVLQRHRQFGVSFLSANQQAIADRFAGRGGFTGMERFAVGRWSTRITGAPVLDDALATIDCELEEIMERHSHLIVIGRVLATGTSDLSDPLLHWRSDFTRVTPALRSD